MGMYKANPKDGIFLKVLNDVDGVHEYFPQKLDLKVIDPGDVEHLSAGSITEAQQFELFGTP
jgi:hypothetical protein